MALRIVAALIHTVVTQIEKQVIIIAIIIKHLNLNIKPPHLSEVQRVVSIARKVRLVEILVFL